MKISKELLVGIIIVAVVVIAILSFSLIGKRGSTGMVSGSQGGIAPQIGQPSSGEICPCGCGELLDDCNCAEARRIKG